MSMTHLQIIESKQVNRKDGETDRETKRQKDKIKKDKRLKTERLKNRETERQKDKKAERQKDRKTERKKDRKTHYFHFASQIFFSRILKLVWFVLYF